VTGVDYLMQFKGGTRKNLDFANYAEECVIRTCLDLYHYPPNDRPRLQLVERATDFR
jgi:hypothetical protein